MHPLAAADPLAPRRDRSVPCAWPDHDELAPPVGGGVITEVLHESGAAA